MATTTNYGWTTPDDTALVKDGASAIRTLGTAIDTTTFNNAAAAIAKTIVDAKGDIIAATAADTVSRLAVGANDTVLTADSTAATGLKWATPTASGTNWSLLNAGGTALTGAATITVSGISAKDKVMIIVAGGSSVNASADFYWRFNTDATANYNFFGGRNAWSATYASGNNCQARNLTGANEITWGTMAGGATSAVSGYLQISGCNASGVKMFHGANGVSGAANQTAETNQIGGWYAGTSTISSISVVSSSGNFDAGTVYVYTSAN
jgi:hypothetical protein